MLRGTQCLAAAFCSVIFLSALDADAARFYRHVDEHGNVTFSDRPSGEAAEQIEVKVHTPPVAPSPLAKANARPTDGEKGNDENEQERERDNASQEDIKALQATRAANCTQARENLQKLKNVSRLYTEDEKGERSYMSDEDRLQALSTAREAIKGWCQ